jgi:hypothetical protein
MLALLRKMKIGDIKLTDLLFLMQVKLRFMRNR